MCLCKFSFCRTDKNHSVSDAAQESLILTDSFAMLFIKHKLFYFYFNLHLKYHWCNEYAPARVPNYKNILWYLLRIWIRNMWRFYLQYISVKSGLWPCDSILLLDISIDYEDTFIFTWNGRLSTIYFSYILIWIVLPVQMIRKGPFLSSQ